MTAVITTRQRFGWTVTLAGSDGSTSERDVRAYWSPEHELSAESAGHAAATEAWRESHTDAKRRTTYQAIAVRRNDELDDAPPAELTTDVLDEMRDRDESLDAVAGPDA